MGYRGYRPHGPWGLWAMGAQRVWGTKGMDNGVQGYGVWAIGHRGYGPHRQWVTWAMGYRGMGDMGNEAHWGYRVQGYGAHGQ